MNFGITKQDALLAVISAAVARSAITIDELNTVRRALHRLGIAQSEVPALMQALRVSDRDGNTYPRYRGPAARCTRPATR